MPISTSFELLDDDVKWSRLHKLELLGRARVLALTLVALFGLALALVVLFELVPTIISWISSNENLPHMQGCFSCLRRFLQIDI